MSWLVWFAIAFGGLVLVWAGVVAALIVMGRRNDARALAGFIPDCLILMKRLIADPRVPRRRKLLLVGLVGYLALPFDLIPDFIPVAGQLDDVIVVGSSCDRSSASTVASWCGSFGLGRADRSNSSPSGGCTLASQMLFLARPSFARWLGG